MEAVAADMVIVGPSVVRKDCATVLLCARCRVNKRKSVAGDVTVSFSVRFCSPLYSRMNSLSESSYSDSSPHRSLLLMRGLGSCGCWLLSRKRMSPRRRREMERSAGAFVRPRQKWLCGLHQVRSRCISERRLVGSTYVSKKPRQDVAPPFCLSRPENVPNTHYQWRKGHFKEYISFKLEDTCS